MPETNMASEQIVLSGVTRDYDNVHWEKVSDEVYYRMHDKIKRYAVIGDRRRSDSWRQLMFSAIDRDDPEVLKKYNWRMYLGTVAAEVIISRTDSPKCLKVVMNKDHFIVPPEGRVKCARYIFNHFKSDYRKTDIFNPVFSSATLDIIEVLYDVVGKFEPRDLNSLAVRGDLEIFKYVFSRSKGYLPDILQWAIYSESIDMVKYIVEHCPRVTVNRLEDASDEIKDFIKNNVM